MLMEATEDELLLLGQEVGQEVETSVEYLTLVS